MCAPAVATAERMRWLARRKQFSYRGIAYGLTTLPVVYFNVNKRWTYGGRLHWTDYGRVPYRYKVVLGWRQSPERKFGYAFRLAVPHILGTGFGFTLRASLNRSLGRYFGRGNSSAFQEDRLDPRHPAFRDEAYCQYSLDQRGAATPSHAGRAEDQVAVACPVVLRRRRFDPAPGARPARTRVFSA